MLTHALASIDLTLGGFGVVIMALLLWWRGGGMEYGAFPFVLDEDLPEDDGEDHVHCLAPGAECFELPGEIPPRVDTGIHATIPADFEIRVGWCRNCDAAVIRAKMRHEDAPFFKRCRTAYARKHIAAKDWKPVRRALRTLTSRGSHRHAA